MNAAHAPPTVDTHTHVHNNILSIFICFGVMLGLLHELLVIFKQIICIVLYVCCLTEITIVSLKGKHFGNYYFNVF